MYVSSLLIYKRNQLPQPHQSDLLRFFRCLGGAATLTEPNHLDGKERPAQATQVHEQIIRPEKRSYLNGLLRGLAAFAICTVLIVAVGLGIVYFMLQGQAGDTSAVAKRIQSELQALAGENLTVELGNTSLDLSDIGRLQLASNDIRITDKVSGGEFANIGSLKIGLHILELIQGKTGFDTIRIEDALVDASVISSDQALVLPQYLDEPLDAAGSILARLNESLTNQTFESFEIRNSRIIGPVLGRRSTDPLEIGRIQIRPRSETGFSVNGQISSEQSDIVFSSEYSPFDEGINASQYEFGATGIGLAEWFEAPTGSAGFLGADSTVNVSGLLSFDVTNNALDPELKLITTPGQLRIGRDSVSEISKLELNVRLILDRNQIELDPSEIEIGGLKATLIGGIKPEDGVKGYFGPILYDMIMKHGVNQPVTEGEDPVPAAFKFAGVYDRIAQTATIDRMLMTTQKGFIEGSGKLGLTDPSPAIVAEARTEGISIAALKQFWPYFISKRARKWVHDHVFEGWVTAGSFDMDVPAGVILNLNKGAELSPEQYNVTLDVENFAFRPLGELPLIRKAKGAIRLEGMKLLSTMTEGVTGVEGNDDITIEAGSFSMENFATPDRWGEAEVEASGNIQTLAAISDRKPLRVMERMKVAADQFSGNGHANIAARFPVGRKAEYGEVNWNVLLDMQDGKSSKKLAGRSVSDADILIDASPTGAQVTGTMNIDGIKSRVNMIEPIGKSGKVKRSRTVTSTLDDEGRKALGINLSPVLEGSVGVKIVQDGEVERYELDFEKATLNLPWVGWSKGTGIPATGSFVLKRLKNGVRLEKFSLAGSSFSGSGTLQIDKKGLVKADLVNVRLNEGDDVILKVERTNEAYNINASGLSYDARGVLNTLIYKGGFTSAQGGRSVNLVANFETVRGFGNRIVRDVILIYESVGGQLRKLDMRGIGSEGRQYSVQAQLNGDDTLFNIQTNDAGTALAFTDIYTRMEGGLLEASLIQGGSGPYIGPVRIREFAVVNEPRLSRIASSASSQIRTEDGEWERSLVNDSGDQRVRFLMAEAQIQRGKGFFNVSDAIIRSTGIGLAMEGIVYDENDNMNLTGTFMPANGVNLAVSLIPLLGQLFSDGKKNALIGITYKLEGPRSNPELRINPLSVVAPGLFNRVFEFKQ